MPTKPIDPETINAVKTGVDLVELVKSKGITLTKNGKGYVGLCPFHDDKTPSLSITPSTNLWQCFGCGLGGDVIRFVELIDKQSFPEAVKHLSGNTPPSLKRTGPVQTDNTQAPLSVKEKKLLSRVVDYYQHTFTQDTTGHEYLKNRGITDNRSIEDFGAGYVNGTLRDILPDDREIIDSLKKIGILNTKGNEVFYDCVVFPLLNPAGSVVSLYGRSVNENAKVKHLYLKGPRGGIVNRQAVKRSETIILTESIIDALTLYDRGFKNVIPLYGVNGLTPDHLFILNRNIKQAYLAFDADEAGRACAEKTKGQLKEKNIASYRIDLPVKDVNEFFISHTPESFETLLKKAHPESVERSDTLKKREQTQYQQTDCGFIVSYGTRQYQIKGIQKSTTQLKITVKASTATDSSIGERPFELTTIDLYSSRSRAWFVKVAAELFTESEDLIKEDVGRLLALAEDYRKSEQKETESESTPEEIEAARRFLDNPHMFEEILTDLEITGIIGEETNKLVGYLAAISRKLDDPLSVLVQSRSAAGKSTLQDAVLSLVPPEDYVKYTRITDQALFYKDEDSLVHKILAIEEEVGMGGAAYSIRNIQTSKKITVAATGKDPATGKMRTEEYTVNGPIAVMITTTSADLEGETASRFLFVTIDESAEMTAAIHTKQREADTLDGLINKTKSEAITRKHHVAQRLLKSVAVVNPYTKYLRYPSGNLRTRRDHKKYLGLIKAIACLHQFQRKAKTVTVDGKIVDYIDVELSDIDKANHLANKILGQCLDDLAKPSRTLLNAIYKMVQEMTGKGGTESEESETFFFNRRMIREYTGWTDWQVRAHIKQLEEMEYLYARMGSRGKEYAYALNYKGQGEDEDRFYLNLTPVKEIKRLLKQEQVKAAKNK